LPRKYKTDKETALKLASESYERKDKTIMECDTQTNVEEQMQATIREINPNKLQTVAGGKAIIKGVGAGIIAGGIVVGIPVGIAESNKDDRGLGAGLGGAALGGTIGGTIGGMVGYKIEKGIKNSKVVPVNALQLARI
jgi:hypothetical protein